MVESRLRYIKICSNELKGPKNKIGKLKIWHGLTTTQMSSDFI